MEKRDALKYVLVIMISMGLIGILIVLRGGLTGFAIFGSSEISAFAQTEIFFDGFESGISGWSLSHASGANDWTASTTDPYQGSYHAQSQPSSTTEPASIMEKTISSSGYQSIIINYSRKLVGLDGVDEFQVKWFDGSTWQILEQTGANPADDLAYVSKQFSLGSGANNNAAFAIKFECTAGAVSEFCRVDNVKIVGDEIIIDTTAPDISIIYPQNISYSVNVGLLNYTASDANLQACWYSLNNGLANATIICGQNASRLTSSEGSNSWKIWANDSAGNVNLSSVSFVVDTIKPILTINSPSNQNYNTNSILVNVSAYDANLGSVWFYNGSANLSYSYGYYSFNQGSSTMIAYANDSAGNLNSSSVSFYVDSIAPAVNIILPQEGATYGYNASIALNYSAYDLNLASCWYNINNGNNISLSNCANTTFSVAGNGNYVLNLYSNDSLGNLGIDTVSFSVQVGSPTIILNSPIDSYLNNQAVIFSYTPTDIDLQSCELWGNFDGEFKLNQTDNSPDNGINNIFNLNLNDGAYLWNIRCFDDVGNSAFNGNKTFYIDVIAPSVSLTQPTGAKTSRTVSASWSVSDTNLNACWYNVYRGASPEIANTVVNCSLNSINFDVSSDGSFIFSLYANDSAGNLNNASSSFSVDTSTPVSPPSGGSGGGGGGGGSAINVTQSGKLSVSLIGNIIAREGDKKTLSLNVKNIGKIFLNNCRLIAKGDINSWIYSTNIKGIAPGQNIDFVFDLNVPEETLTEINMGSLEIKCEEASYIQNISVSIPEEMGLIKIKDIKQEGDILKINYAFDSSKFVGDSIDIEIWLADENGTEIKRIVDKSPLNIAGLVERNVEMQLPGGLEGGVYFIYFAFSNDINSFVKKSVVLGVTGRAVLDSEKGKFGVYIVFLLIIAVAIFFIWRRHGKENRSEHLVLLKERAVRKGSHKPFG